MFYCDEDAERRGWPVAVLSRSFGRCEICGQRRDSNDVPSSHLPEPRQGAAMLPEETQ